MIFFLLSFTCQRYLSHGYLIMLIAFSCYTSDSLSIKNRLNRSKSIAVFMLMVILMINSFTGIRYNALISKIVNGHYEAVGRWMAKNVPKGELIFHANWSDSQYFIGLNPKNDYFVTLDPVYMYNKNPELYKIYRDVSFGRTKDPYALLKDTFNVKYGYA